MNLILIRHAQSDYNVRHLLNENPAVEINLTDTGRHQAIAAGRKLKKFKFKAVYVSEFPRTQATARLLLPGKKSVVDPRINEIKSGFEGRPNWIWLAWQLWIRLMGRLEAAARPDGESWQDVLNRCRSFVDDLKRRHGSDDTVLIVSHTATIQMLLAAIDGIDIRRAIRRHLPNAGVVKRRI